MIINTKYGKGHWAVYYICPQSFIIKFLILWDSYWTLISSIIKWSVPTFQPLIVIYRKCNFVYHHWGWTPIYRPLSYPFISLINIDWNLKVVFLEIQFWKVLTVRKLSFMGLLLDNRFCYLECTDTNLFWTHLQGAANLNMNSFLNMSAN